MASPGRGDGGQSRQPQARQSQVPVNFQDNQNMMRGIQQGMKQLQVSGQSIPNDQQNEQQATPWTVTNITQDKRSTRHARALMEIRNSLQSYEIGAEVDRELLDRCLALGFDEEISRETLRASRGKEFGVVLATLMSMTQLSGGKSIKSLAPGSLQYVRGGSPGGATNARLVRNEQGVQNQKMYGHPQTQGWGQPTTNPANFIKSAAVPPGRLDNRATFVRRTGIDVPGKGPSGSSNDPFRVDRSQFNIGERKISETTLNNYPEVRLRQNRPSNRDSQKRWSADVLQKAKAYELPNKRNSLAFEVGDRRSPFDIPNKPPPPYPGFPQSHTQQDTRIDQWQGSIKMQTGNGNIKRFASLETVAKIGTESPRINSPLTIETESRKHFLNGSELQATQDMPAYQNIPINKQLPLREPPPYHVGPHLPLKRTYSPNERTGASVVSRLYPVVSMGQQVHMYGQSNGPQGTPVDNAFIPIRPEPIRPDTVSENSFNSGQDDMATSRGSPPPYPGLEFRVTAKEKRFSYASDVDSGTSSKRASAIFGDGSTQSDSSGSTSPTPETIESRCSPLPMTNSPFHTLVIHPNERIAKSEDEEIKCNKEPISSRLKSYSSQAFKFYMEQHVENVLKSRQLREKRRKQLEVEMIRVGLSEESQFEMRKMLVQKESNHIRMKRSKMTRSMFSKVKTLGMGAFGEVALVQKIDSNALYAMKVLRKTDVLRRNQVAHVKAERDILAEADNEWVVKLYYSFQDNTNLYFVMEYVPGGDLMALLIKRGIFDEELGRFYTAELVLAVESVHKMGFIHRDIKPDNVLIDRNGHIKLTDFGLCTGFRWTHDSKYYQQDPNHARQPSMEPEGGWEQMLNDGPCDCGDIIKRFDLCKPLDRRAVRRHMRCLAHSLVGTPNYIAPEVLLRIPYTQLCDWWSVGVILYEMLVGQPPFLASSAAETQTKVVHWQSSLRIPRHAKLSREAEDLIIRLCTSADNRIGGQGADEIKRHPFFIGVDWANSLKSKPPPYIPKIKHATDTSNFDAVPEKDTENEPDDTYDEERMRILEKGPQHAFYEFTFRRFFDEGGHPQTLCDEEEMQTDSPQGQNGFNVHNNKRTVTTSDKSVPVPSKVPAPPISQGKLEDKAPVYV